MAETTGISWADHTFNPWIGCTEVSAGCDNCYARDFTRNRMGLEVWGAGVPRRRTTPAYWRQLRKWSEAAKRDGVRRRAFPSMCDPGDAEVSEEWFTEFLDTALEADGLDILLLTKRPGELMRRGMRWMVSRGLKEWPAHFWVGTSMEASEVLWRLRNLKRFPAAVRFLSIEPLLGPLFDLDLEGVDWVIVGGESGPKRRPFELAWAEDIREQCERAGVAAELGRTLNAGGGIVDE